MPDWAEVKRAMQGRLGGRWTWGAFGPDGICGQEHASGKTVIATASEYTGTEWCHASVTVPGRLPSYHDLCALHDALWPHGFAYQVFAPPEKHVNLHTGCLHLWGRADGANVLPDFGRWGTI